MTNDVHYEETPFGFIFGDARVTRLWSNKGRVCIRVSTSKHTPVSDHRKGAFNIYVTKTGMVRIFSDDIELKPSKGE